MLSRREWLRRAGLVTLGSTVPTLTLADGPGEARFVLVIQRGAADGLALVAPYADPRYAELRAELALGPPGNDDGLAKLDGLFGLHPALPGLHGLYRGGEALFLHAVASPYRERSHFDGQDVLENGSATAGIVRTGWLNRALAGLAGPGSHAVALAQNTPLVLRGDEAVTSWAPSRLPEASDDTLRRLAALYEQDEFFASRLGAALETRDIAGAAAAGAGGRRGGDVAEWRQLTEAAARFLAAADGPRIAVLETGGWDTHSNQGAASGSLANRLAGLDAALLALKHGLGPHWRQTVVVAATEFGRTAATNGTRGTDHGTATAAIVLGGAVDGGRVVADWPGLRARDLYQGRDLFPTTDLRGVFKSVLAEHLELPASFVEGTVFPDSAAAPPLEGLIRA